MKKKITFIIPSFRKGGAERVTLNIINSLDIETYAITLIICTGTNNTMLQNLQPGINVVELEKNNVREALPSIFKSIRNTVPDIVFSTFNHISLPVLLYKFFCKLKFKTVIRMNTLPSIS